jgi:predicted transcriptional regulator
MSVSRRTQFPGTERRENVKRSRHTIVSQILDVCNGGASKTKIVYQANLNFRTVNPYIELLTKNGLIEIKSGRPVMYETTDKGLKLQESFKRIDGGLDLM